ncbi:hypothetical protein [Streptomyces sp. F001]|nr:hypothetical protein [Streptomyces sp. F001]
MVEAKPGLPLPPGRSSPEAHDIGLHGVLYGLRADTRSAFGRGRQP